MKKFKIQITFEKQLILIAVLIISIPLIFSYYNLIVGTIKSYDDKNRESLMDVGGLISEDERVNSTLAIRKNDGTIQKISTHIVESFDNIDIIVVGDMSGEKYSHIIEEQIGEIFIGCDKERVLDYGESYFSLMEGSIGKTLRWFEPIYSMEEQVGFVMVGKSYDDILKIENVIKFKYIFQGALALFIGVIVSKKLAKKVKAAMYNMEPHQISRLYGEKKIIIDTVSEGIVALNRNNEITEINGSCNSIIKGFDANQLVKRLEDYINSSEEFEYKEFIFSGKRIFINLKRIMEGDKYLGTVITFVDREGINKVAKEITGVDEVVKNLRASAHEFKNTLYVLLGLLQLKKYNEAEDYILKVRENTSINTNKFNTIEDYYVRALLLSREKVSKERKIPLEITEGSFLNNSHGIISSLDLVTIIGNLIENAFEACLSLKEGEGKVEITLYEDEKQIEIQVLDNGEKIPEDMKGEIFKEGVSLKGRDRGTGLYLVKSRVELYNGDIEIDEFKTSKAFVITIFKE